MSVAELLFKTGAAETLKLPPSAGRRFDAVDSVWVGAAMGWTDHRALRKMFSQYGIGSPPCVSHHSR